MPEDQPLNPLDPVAPTHDMKKLIDEAGTLHSEMKAKHDAAIKRNEKLYERLGLDADGEEKHNLKEMADQLADLEVTLQKMRRARVAGTAEGAPVSDPTDYRVDPVSQAQEQIRKSVEYRRALDVALRKGGDRYGSLDADAYNLLTFKSLPEHLEEAIPDEVKSGLSSEFEPGAGFLAPPTMESEIDKVLLENSPLWDLARTVNIGSSSYEGLIRTANRDEIKQVGERAERSQRTELKRYEKRRIEVHESEAAPALTQTLLEDSDVDLVAELQADATEDFLVDMGRKLVHGTGNDEAEGLMVSNELLTFASGVADGFNMDSLRKIPQELKTGYKAGSVYLLSREAVTETMLFREDTGAGAGTGAYMWQPSTQEGIPSRLNGYGWREMVDMDAVAAGAWPVAFGNFFQAYRIANRRGIRILRDDLTAKPYVIFFMTKRYGGRVWKGEAAVKMKCATSL